MLCNLRHNNLVNNLLFLFNDLIFFIKKRYRQDITCQESYYTNKNLTPI